MKFSKILLEKFTLLFPPKEGCSHSLTLSENNNLKLNLMTDTPYEAELSDEDIKEYSSVDGINELVSLVGTSYKLYIS